MKQAPSAVRVVSLWAAAFACAVATLAQAAPSKQWSITNLGALGARGSIPLAINNRGEIVGYSAAPVPGQPYDAYHPFVWENGTMTDLGRDMGNPPGSAFAEAEAINDKGVIVGSGPGSLQMWQDGVRTPLGFQARAEDINKSGTIVGSFFNGSATQAFVYNDRGFQALTLGGSNSSATAVNDKGVVVGNSQLAGNAVTHAFVYDNGVMRDLGSLGTNSSAVDINSHGAIVGMYQDANGLWKAYIYDRGVMRPLFDSSVDVPAGNQYVAAINDHGAVTGDIDNSAFIYEDGKLTILNTLPQVQAAGWSTLFVMDMNDRGWITGWGWRRDDPSGNGHGFVLMPK